MGIQGAVGRHKREDHVLVELNCLGGGKVIRHDDNGFLCTDTLFLGSLENGKQAFRNVLHIGGTAPHIVILHGGEHACEIVRRLDYGILRVDGLGGDDVFNGIPVIVVLKHHLMDFKYGRAGLAHLLEGLLVEPA